MKDFLQREPGAAHFPLGDVLDFLRAIWAVDHALQRASKRMATAVGVTGPQRFIVRIVGRFPGITAGNLAKVLHMHPSTVTYIVKSLLRRKILMRISDPKDGRRLLLGLTQKGHGIDQATERTIESAVARILARIPMEAQNTTKDVLTCFARDL